MRPSERTVAAAVMVLGGVAVAVLAVWWVPWDPVPGGPVEPVPAEAVFSAAEIARAESYSRWARVWSWSALAVSLAVVALLGFTPAGARMVARLPGRWWLQAGLAVAAVSVLVRLATLPLAAAGHRHRVDAGLSTQGWGEWLRDVAVAELVSVVATVLAVLVLMGAARRWRRAWPAVAAALVGVLVLLGSFVYPVLVEPLFNDFRSLPEGPLRADILELAAAEDVAVDDVLVSDASRRTTTLNAYVSGFGSTRRVVVYDTLLDGAERRQVLSVVAHELAHARHGDVLVGTLLGAAGALTGVGALGLLVRRRSMADPRVVPWLLALVALASVASAPVQNGISRKLEVRADVEALVATDDPHAFVGLQRTLALRSLADPTPPAFSQVWWGSHPVVLERIGLACREVSSRCR